MLRLARQQDATRHAYLFLGPEHIGKTTLARAFAQALTCENPEGETGLGACGRCRSCRLAAEGMHPDHRFFAPAGNQLVIEQIREVVREASRSPIESRFKVFIITSFERANVNAANALLKTLEEPSATTRIILVSHQPSGLLDTIISRCQLLRLRPLPKRSLSPHCRNNRDSRNRAPCVWPDSATAGWEQHSLWRMILTPGSHTTSVLEKCWPFWTPPQPNAWRLLRPWKKRGISKPPCRNGCCGGAMCLWFRITIRPLFSIRITFPS